MRMLAGFIVLILFASGLSSDDSIASYNFHGRVNAPCPYPKELAEKKPAAPYLPDPGKGECGPPLLHQYGEKYGSRSFYDPRERGGVLHMKYSHPFFYDIFRTEKPIFEADLPFRARLVAAVQYSYGMESALCSISAVRLLIRNYSPLTGAFNVVLDDGTVRLSSEKLEAETYQEIEFGRDISGKSFLLVNGAYCVETEKSPGAKAPSELVIGGANDIKISEIIISGK